MVVVVVGIMADATEDETGYINFKCDIVDNQKQVMFFFLKIVITKNRSTKHYPC